MNPNGPTLEDFEGYLANTYSTVEDTGEATSLLLSLERLRAFRREYRSAAEVQQILTK